MREPCEEVVEQLRAMARRGEGVSNMFDTLRKQLGPDIVAIMDHMKAAFHLSLAEVKSIAALSRADQRTILDRELLEQLMAPAIARHRGEWNNQQEAVTRKTGTFLKRKPGHS